MSLVDETTAVREGHAIDEARLLSHLTDVVPEIGHDASLRQFQGGQSNPTYLIADRNRFWVLRKKPPGNLLPSAHAIDREYRVMHALGGAKVPVPRMIHYCHDESIVGTEFYVMEGIEGRIFRDVALPEVAPSERRAIYEAMGLTLANLHTADWAGLGLSDFGKPANYLARQVARWSKQYQASRTDDLPAMDAVMGWLAANVPQEETVSIVHGDFRLENFIFHPTEPKPLALLDWELATLGHPLADLAYNCLPWRLPAEFLKLGGLNMLPPESGIPGEAEYIALYCEYTGRKSIEDWDYYTAFSLFRSAAILQGVYARALQKSASNANALEVGKLAKVAAEVAWEIIR